MAKIAIVQSYPYDAVAGGDGAYIQSFAQYLSELGHDIHGFVTDTTRGRKSPIYESFYRVDKYRSWRVRHAVRVNRRIFLNCHFSPFLAKLLEKLGVRGRIAEAGVDQWAPREAFWISKQLQDLRPDITILCFDAVHFASLLTSVHGSILALPGPIPGRELRPRSINQLSCIDPKELSTIQTRLAGALAHADCVAFNSRDDLIYAMERLHVKRAIVVGMGFASQAVFAESNEPIVMFVGNATWPNRVGIRWFLAEVWPVIRASCPDARFRLVGRVAFSSEANGGEGIDRIGPVTDLAPEYKLAQVVIAPLVSGTAGVKIKVAEAMSYGRPLVSTSIGVDRSDPRQLDPAAIIADDPREFAHGIIALLKDQNLRREKSTGASSVFKRCFSYDASYCDLSGWIDRVVRSTGCTTGQSICRCRN